LTVCIRTGKVAVAGPQAADGMKVNAPQQPVRSAEDKARSAGVGNERGVLGFVPGWVSADRALRLQSVAGNRAVTRLLARNVRKATPAPPLRVALTPQEMWQQVFYKRGIESRYPPHAVAEARARLEAARAALRKSPKSKVLASGVKQARKRLETALRNRSERLPARGNAPDKRRLGHGTKTVAAVQVVDAEGRQVGFALGEYQGGGGPHAEEQALEGIRAQLRYRNVPQDRNAGKGWRVVVVVDQSVCPDRCRPALARFAEDFGVARESVVAHHPRVLGGKSVSPKTASQTAHQRATGIAAGDPGEAVLVKPVEPPAPKPGPAKLPVEQTPTPKGRSETPARRPSIDPRTNARPASESVEVKTPRKPPPTKLVDIEMDVSAGRIRGARVKAALKLGGRILRVAPHVLEVWSALSALGTAFDKLDSLSHGGLDAATREVIKRLDAAFPPVEKLAVDAVGPLTAAEFRASATYLENAGELVGEHGELLVPADRRQDEDEILAWVGYHVAQADRYARSYPDVEQVVLDYYEDLVPLLQETERQTAFVRDVGDEVLKLATTYAWLPFAGEQLGFMYLEIDNAAFQYSAIGGRMSSKLYEYDRWLMEAGDVVDFARALIGDWGPRWEAGGRRKVGTN
jgi:hypothetical protein